MALQMGTARTQRITGTGTAQPRNIAGTYAASGMQPTAVSTGINLGMGAYNQIPGVPVQSPTDPNGRQVGSGIGGSQAPGGGGGAALPALNTAAIDNTQRAIDELPGLLQAALAAERQNRLNALSGFDAQEQQQRGTYDKSTTTNQLNYDSNFMDSLRSGVRGIGSLMNILRGTGAGGGTVVDNVRDMVGGITAGDIRSGADTQQANQSELDTVLGNFLTELRGKRQGAEDTFVNNERAIRRDNASQMQDLFGKMAGFFGDAGRSDEANSWMARAGELTPQIASNSRAQVSAYDRSPIAVQAPQLTAFSGSSQPDAAVIPQDGRVGSGIFTMGRGRERERELSLPMTAGV